MKQVLIIDQTTVFKDYLIKKLKTSQTHVIQGVGHLDSLSKMRTDLPDLVVIDYSTTKEFLFSLLQAKMEDPNAKGIPIIILIQAIDTTTALKLAVLGIKHILPKPIKIDQFFSIARSYLNIDIEIDDTPCILEARVNDNIIFVEIAQGLNREKIEILQFKIKELIELYGLAVPKILVMMTDLSLSFIDGTNLELLLQVLMANSSIKNQNIILLTLDSFVSEFVKGDSSYKGIQVLQNLSKAMDFFVKNLDPEDSIDIINDKLLSSHSNDNKITSLEMRFKSEIEQLKREDDEYKIAIVDDDITIRTIVSNTLKKITSQIHTFENGSNFLDSLQAKQYDLVFLDLLMPVIDGFAVLNELRKKQINTPIIVLSAISQREQVVKVLSSGVKSYMIKPINPDAILKKTIELLSFKV